MHTNQEKYVPCNKCDEENIILEHVPLHGDQLLEERSRNAKWSLQDGDTGWDRLDGIETEFADWHAKLNFYMVIINKWHISNRRHMVVFNTDLSHPYGYKYAGIGHKEPLSFILNTQFH